MLKQLEDVAVQAKKAGTAVAFGEIGLDYDRLMLTEKSPQLKYFEAQLDLAVKLQLPLFLHSRAAGEDFARLLKSRLDHLPKKGLVHSFTGTMGEMESLVALGLDIGVNGCSLKTEENLEVVRAIPLERMQIETDGPWASLSNQTSHSLTDKQTVRMQSKPCLLEAPDRSSSITKVCEEGEIRKGMHDQG
jgi:TatD DNase family protein